MELASRMYGVTMVEPGISRVIGADMTTIDATTGDVAATPGDVAAPALAG